jgi:hypothetical protein
MNKTSMKISAISHASDLTTTKPAQPIRNHRSESKRRGTPVRCQLGAAHAPRESRPEIVLIATQEVTVDVRSPSSQGTRIAVYKTKIRTRRLQIRWPQLSGSMTGRRLNPLFSSTSASRGPSISQTFSVCQKQGVGSLRFARVQLLTFSAARSLLEARLWSMFATCSEGLSRCASFLLSSFSSVIYVGRMAQSSEWHFLQNLATKFQRGL